MTSAINNSASRHALMTLGVLGIAGYLCTSTWNSAIANDIGSFGDKFDASPVGFDVRNDSLRALQDYARSDALPTNINENVLTPNQTELTLALSPVIEEINPTTTMMAGDSYHVQTVGFGARTERMEYEQSHMLLQLDNEANTRYQLAKTVLNAVGIDAASLVPQSAPNNMEIVPDAVGYSDFNERVQEVTDHITRARSVALVLLSAPFANPLDVSYRSTSGFGMRVDPFTGQRAFHPGYDMAAYEGANVRSTQAGTIVYAGERSGYGNCVEIDHGHGFKTRYGHLESITVHVGDRVDLGDLVGHMGSTGRSTATHLHYEVWYNGELQNPANYLEAGRHYFNRR